MQFNKLAADSTAHCVAPARCLTLSAGMRAGMRAGLATGLTPQYAHNPFTHRRWGLLAPAVLDPMGGMLPIGLKVSAGTHSNRQFQRGETGSQSSAWELSPSLHSEDAGKPATTGASVNFPLSKFFRDQEGGDELELAKISLL